MHVKRATRILRDLKKISITILTIELSYSRQDQIMLAECRVVPNKKTKATAPEYYSLKVAAVAVQRP